STHSLLCSIKILLRQIELHVVEVGGARVVVDVGIAEEKEIGIGRARGPRGGLLTAVGPRLIEGAVVLARRLVIVPSDGRLAERAMTSVGRVAAEAELAARGHGVPIGVALDRERVRLVGEVAVRENRTGLKAAWCPRRELVAREVAPPVASVEPEHAHII